MALKITGIIPSQDEPKIIRRGWSKSLGDYVERIWEGPQSSMESVYASRGLVDEASIENNGAIYRVSMRVAGVVGEGETEIPVDDVRLDVVSENKTIQQNDRYSDISIARKKEIVKAAEVGEVITISSVLPLEQELYDYVRLGVKYTTVYQPVLIRTWTASRQYEFDIAWANTGKIITPANIASDAGLTNFERFNLPNDTVTGSAYFFYGWLKHPFTYESSGGGRYVLTQRYSYGKWPVHLYQLAS